MSYFPNMFTTKEGMTSWLLQINSHGEVVLYSLDANGSPQSFVSGNPADVLRTPLEQAKTGYYLACVHTGLPDIEHPLNWLYPYCDSWTEARDCLNQARKAKRWSKKAASLLGSWHTVLHLRLPIRKYLDFDHENDEYILGPEGRKYDKMRRSQETEEAREAMKTAVIKVGDHLLWEPEDPDVNEPIVVTAMQNGWIETRSEKSGKVCRNPEARVRQFCIRNETPTGTDATTAPQEER
jgi:hypothetical protein